MALKENRNMKTITVEVKQEHITGGTPRDCQWCPIALAMEDAGIKHPMVSKAGWDQLFNRNDGLTEWGTSAENISAFIEAFDAGDPVKPFSFTITI